jgi:4a-hydroxytetrahydrobiopterin dehydratase
MVRVRLGGFGGLSQERGTVFYTRAASRGKADIPRGDGIRDESRTFRLKCPLPMIPLVLPKPKRIMADLLNAQDIKAWLKKLPQWDHDKKHIERVFEFDDFSQAIEFVNGVAEIAEEDDHHPDIDIRYSKVTVRLSTHSEGGLTDLDFEVAEKIDTLVDE